MESLKSMSLRITERNERKVNVESEYIMESEMKREKTKIIESEA